MGLAAIVAVYGCSGDSDSPTGPARSLDLAPVAVAGDCGVDAYLTSLSSALPAWQDSISVAFAPVDPAPTYGDDSEPEAYLAQLAPVLQQWEMTINTEADSAIVDTVPSFDAESDDVPQYLLGLSDLLQQWKGAIDTWVGRDYLPAPPVYLGDQEDPVIVCPDPEDTVFGCADSSGVVVDFEGLIVVTDDCDPSPDLTCEPASGTKFPLGETMVTCTATDSVGNSTECQFVVLVEFADPPVIDCPADTTVECAGPEGTTVEFEVTATSECDTAVVVECEPASGSAFPTGETVVTCTATDSFGNVTECTFKVIVEDTTPPVITCPADTTLECTGDGSAVLEFAATATDICDPEPVVECDPPSGTAFPLGETVVTCTARDAAGNEATCTFTVKVEDTTPPVIHGAEPSKEYLWPPNHKMVSVSVSVDVTDICDSTIDCYIYDVTSNEPINGRGDGNTEPDWEITGDLTVDLRAERAGPLNGRTYYVYFRCEDDSGNSADHMVEVHVPHDRGNGTASE